ncbi:hypothetical protein ACIBSW_09015 [Actinoplanes sp. NPDC049668]|uniref:hypothetical protein n=1 Tax=unclassified Actinoplanes TaxID=2626549 RepID=UPI0033A290F0
MTVRQGLAFAGRYEAALWIARRPYPVEPGTAAFGVGSQTSIDVVLSRPLTVAHKKTGGRPVTQIRFHADDPEALVAAAQQRLTPSLA